MLSQRNKALRTVGAIIFMLSMWQVCSAAIRPSFEIRRAAWHATDIVLVRAESIGGQFTVIETMKGDLKPGDNLTIPTLKPDGNARSLASYPIKYFYSDRDPNTRIPKQAAGDRMFLFLRRQENDKLGEWIGASGWDDLKSSTVWIDRGQSYCFIQVMNPGPSALVNCGMDEAKIRSTVTSISEVQRRLQEIGRMEPSLRGKELQSFIASDLRKAPIDRLPDARKFALELIGDCGQACLPQIRDMLHDESFSRVGAELVDAFAKAGRSGIEPELTLTLEGELRYWRSTGPSLSSGWWNLDMTEDSPLRNRYSKTLELIRVMKGTRSPGAAETVTALRDFWRSLPQLNDPSGLNQMVHQCDQYLEDVAPKR